LPLTAIVQSADAIASYNWDFGNGINGIGQNITATYVSTGAYTVRLISRTAFGCADTVYRTVHSTDSLKIDVGPDIRICRGQTAQLGAIGANTWQWTPTQNLSCTTCPNPLANPLFTTSYIVTGNIGPLCRAKDTIKIEVIQPLDVTVSNTVTICFPDSVQIFAAGAYSYIWSPAASLSNAFISDPWAKPAATTVYQVVGKDRYNCFADTAFVRVNVGQNPIVKLGSDTTVMAGSTMALRPVITNGPIVSYNWTPATGLSCSTCQFPSALVNSNISYRLEVRNTLGCIGSDTIHYTVICDKGQMYVPNAFSPDGDGKNDVFMIRGKGIASIKFVRIFNRFGELVYERANISANDASQGWNGRINNVPAQTDVYMVTADVLCTGGTTFSYKGDLTLVRY